MRCQGRSYYHQAIAGKRDEVTKRLLGLREIQSTEAVVAQATSSAMPSLARNHPGLLDIYTNMAYFLGDQPEPMESDANFYWFFAFQSYTQTPYTFAASFDLATRGYYTETVVLVRNIIEILAQLRYFQENRSALRQHYLGKKIVSFKKMLDRFCPGFYDGCYGMVLSGVAHGRLPVFRFDKTGDQAIPRMGCQFDHRQADFVFRNLLYLLYGFLNYFPIFFPGNILGQEREMLDDVADAKRWIYNAAIETTDISETAAETWYGGLKGLILDAK